MHPTIWLGLDKESNNVDNHKYRIMFGSLLYLTTSRPYIMFSICICTIFPLDPREVHLTSTKIIFRYLSGTANLGLCFKQWKELRLIRYCNVNYVGDKLERKSIYGSYHFVGGNVVTWICIKKISI
ncbi:hypothetical protein AAZX31_18G134700 [Glycine max]